VTKAYFLQRFSRLEPCQPWRGGRITDTDLLTLEEAAREACRHSGQEVCVNDFLRAADHGEITLRAIVHTSAKVEKFDGVVGSPQEIVHANLLSRMAACLSGSFFQRQQIGIGDAAPAPRLARLQPRKPLQEISFCHSHSFNCSLQSGAAPAG
jgi:hypothetical protein